MDLCLSLGDLSEMKCKQPCPGFDLRLSIPFPFTKMITIILISMSTASLTLLNMIKYPKLS